MSIRETISRITKLFHPKEPTKEKSGIYSSDCDDHISIIRSTNVKVFMKLEECVIEQEKHQANPDISYRVKD